MIRYAPTFINNLLRKDIDEWRLSLKRTIDEWKKKIYYNIDISKLMPALM